MKAELKNALKSAMKAQDKLRMETVRSLLADIQYEEMQKEVEDLPAADCVSIIQRAVKKRQEEMQFAEQGNRQELISKLKEEIKICEEFLPKQLSASDLETIVTKMKGENPALTLSVAMKQLKDGFAGQYDGKTASDVVKKLLG